MIMLSITRLIRRVSTRIVQDNVRDSLLVLERPLLHNSQRFFSTSFYAFRRTDPLTSPGDPNHQTVQDIYHDFQPTIGRNIHFHNRYLHELCRHGHLEDATLWLRELLQDNKHTEVNPELVILFERVLHGCSIRGETEKMLGIHNLMKEKKIIPNEASNALLIRTYCADPKTLTSALDLYYEMRTKGIKPHAREYLPLITAASENGDLESAWTLFTKLDQYPLVYDNKAKSAFVALTKVLSKCQDGTWLEKVKLFSQFLQNSNFVPSDKLLHALKEMFESSQNNNWKAEYANTNIVNGSLRCCCCGTLLDKLHVNTKTDKEIFQQWTDKIAALAMDTDPREEGKKVNRMLLDKLRKVLHTKGPFDVIIDGLNVGYRSANGKRRVFEVQSIVSVVQYYLQQHKTVLVIGAGPMNYSLLRNPKTAKTSLKKSIRDLLLYLTSTPFVACFLVQQSLLDDYYFIYAAAASGPKTILVTNDKLSNHIAVMDKNPRNNMQRWLQTHQTKVYFSGNKEMTVVEPSPFILSVLIGESSIHFPSSSEKKWLCVQKSPQVKP